ncbi:hypothetical protein B0O99DRAFT_514343 [Bisporella sp. PMI_857]|nr:hypothetical protein B0O99DRAFT_514343 [Bisporella sp. PMI_857]
MSAYEKDARERITKPIHAERHVEIIVVGAGASGLLMAYKLQRHFQNYTLTVFEKNTALSGTWFENKYPGCACDIPAHTYTWSFEPKSDWSAVYAGSEEIYNYFNDFAKKYHLGQYVKLEHQVTGAYWNNEFGGYDVTVRNLTNGRDFRTNCDILINAGGVLNNWRWPAIPGLEKYKGVLLHTANWDETVDLHGKHVGLIGNGSSGIQVLPAIQAQVKHCTTFIREPTWVSPVQGLQQHKYSADEMNEFQHITGSLTKYRKGLEASLNGTFGVYFAGSHSQQATEKYMKQAMAEKIGNKDLEQKLIPKWKVGCRRPTPGVNYLESLTKPNVSVVYGEINSITENGCLCDDGCEYPIDVLICATGFDTTFKPRFPVVSPTGENLEDAWSSDPESYLGLAAANFPNYLIFLGPNCPIGNGPVLSAIEAQADYMCKLIDRFQSSNIATFAPRQEAVADFVAHKDNFMKNMVWSDPCRSWYKSGSIEGKITALWPGSTLHYIEATMDLRMEDWDVKYAGNRFAWLGNGYSQTEVDPTADWAFYIRDKDDDGPLTTGGRRKVFSKSGTITHEQSVGSFLPSAPTETKEGVKEERNRL